MADVEEQFLRETLLQVYRELVPDYSTLGQALMRKLAAGLYSRGARMQIGTLSPPKYETLHISVSKEDLIVWTCGRFHTFMGYQPHSLLRKSIYTILSDDSAAFRRETGLPTLIRDGKLGPVTGSFVMKNGALATGSLTSTIMKDPTGAFSRTFTKIRIPTLLLWFAVGGAPPGMPQEDQRAVVNGATEWARGGAEQRYRHHGR